MLLDIPTPSESSPYKVPSSSPYRKYSQNPFRSERPGLFPASPKRQSFDGSKGPPIPAGDCADAWVLDPAGEISIYQPVLTPEILANFDYMSSLIGAYPPELKCREITLPPSHKKCLVLDLDETLVYTLRNVENCEERLGIDLSEVENATCATPLGKELCFNFILRPYVDEFLTVLAEHYQIIV